MKTRLWLLPMLILWCVAYCSAQQPFLQPAPSKAQQIERLTQAAQPKMQSADVLIDFTKNASQKVRHTRLDAGEISSKGLRIAALKQKGTAFSEVIAVPFVDVAPFLNLSAVVMLENADPQNITLFIRSSTNEKTFGEWQSMNEDTHSENDGKPVSDAPTSKRYVSRLLYLPKETKTVQYKLEMTKTTLYRNPVVKSVKLNFFSPGDTPKEQLEKMQEAATEKKTEVSSARSWKNTHFGSILSAMPRPQFVSRTDWGCPTGQTAGDKQFDLAPTDVTHLIVHHSFEPGNTITDWAAAMRGIWNYHVNSNGWSDIGYNWLIDQNGIIYQGRAWVGENENTRGAHFCGNNTGTMGVCMMGNFSLIPAPEKAVASLVKLLAYKASDRSIDPLGITFLSSANKMLNNISGHRDGTCSTECPGDLLYPVLPDLRKRVADAIKTATDVDTPTNQPFETTLEQNTPNPFDAATQLRYSLHERGFVTLRIHDALGRVVLTLVDTAQEAGEYTIAVHTASLPQGIYYCRLQAGAAQFTKTMVLVR